MKSSIYASKLCYIFGFFEIFSNFFFNFFNPLCGKQKKNESDFNKVFVVNHCNDFRGSKCKTKFHFDFQKLFMGKMPEATPQFLNHENVIWRRQQYTYIYSVLYVHIVYFLEVDTLWLHTEKAVKKMTIKMQRI